MGFDSYGPEEIDAVADCLRRGWLGIGPTVTEFEQQIAARFGKSFGVMVNSGSSANLLAADEIACGSVIATPALTFATTLSSVLGVGEIVLVDVEADTYQIDFDLLPSAPDALVVPNLIGNIPDWTKKPDVATVLEDSCDTIPDVAAPSQVVTTSFYASHVLTACGGGGMVMTDDHDQAIRFKKKRAWGRSLAIESDLTARWASLDGIPYDKQFTYEEIGYNFQPLEIQAAFALVQFSKLGSFLEARRANFARLNAFFTRYEEFFVLPRSRKGANWLAFPLTTRNGMNRDNFVQFLETKDIQTRPIFSGNITRHPAFIEMVGKQTFPRADEIMAGGLLLGCHHGLLDSHLSYLEQTVEEYMTTL